MIRHFIMTTAGHVDHGKSSLVKKLTGIDPDRLPEEKARGITIDLGFADLSLPHGEDTFKIGIVDVPGHEDFVKNMVAGVGAVDLALLVVAADDGWMPQTEEHLEILSYLGVAHMVVALTKADLAGDRLPEIEKAVREHLAGSPFAEAPILSCSTQEAESWERLKLGIRDALTAIPSQADYGKPRLAVDRVFSLKGAGTIVTGSLIGGQLAAGQPVVIHPRNLAAHIRSIHSHNQPIASAAPGTRVALNLPEATRDPDAPNSVRRGDVVMLPGYGNPSSTLDVVLERSNRAQAGKSPSLKQAARVRFHIGSASLSARVSLARQTELKPGERGIAQLRLESPVAIFRGDRFVLRDDSGRLTLAGGRVLDPEGDRRRFRLPARQNFLQQEAEATDSIEAAIEARLQLDSIVPTASLLVNSRFSSTQIHDALSRLRKDNTLELRGAWAISKAQWTGLQQRAVEAIQQEHRNHPERPGLELAKLGTVLGWPAFQPQLTEEICASLAPSGFLRRDGWIKRNDHFAAASPGLMAAARQIQATLSEKRFDPPNRRELAPDKTTQEALRAMIKSGQVVELNSELVMLAEAFVEAQKLLKAHLSAKGSGSVSELRDAIGGTRRTMIPLLEFLDQRGFTKRLGDRRVLAAAKGKPAG